MNAPSLSSFGPRWQRVQDLFAGVRKGRLPGFRFAETMVGSATINGQRRDMAFHLDAAADDLWEHLRTGRTLIHGTVTIAGLAHNAPLVGELHIRPLHDRTIRYSFRFPDESGRTLSFTGQKDLQLLRLPTTLTTLPGELRDEADHLVGEAALRFPLETLPSFLGSFRPLL